jgi:hypothetical protein
MFTQGQQVVCIDDHFAGPLAKHFIQLPVKGTVYTVRAVYLGRKVLHPGSPGAADGEIGVLLKELQNPPDPRNKYGQELGFNGNRFKPLVEDPEHDHASEEAFDSVGQFTDNREPITIHGNKFSMS